MVGQSVRLLGLVGLEQRGSLGEAEGIIWFLSPLPRLAASHHSRKGSLAFHEQAEFRRTQSTKRVFGSRNREEHSPKLTAAHSGSASLSKAHDGAVAVYYEPRAFRDVRELEAA